MKRSELNESARKDRFISLDSRDEKKERISRFFSESSYGCLSQSTTIHPTVGRPIDSLTKEKRKCYSSKLGKRHKRSGSQTANTNQNKKRRRRRRSSSWPLIKLEDVSLRSHSVSRVYFPLFLLSVLVGGLGVAEFDFVMRVFFMLTRFDK